MRLGRIRAFACLALATTAVVSQAQYSRIVKKQAQPLEVTHGVVAVYLNSQATQIPVPPGYITPDGAFGRPGASPGQWFLEFPGKTSEQLVADYSSLPNVKYAAPVFKSTHDRPMIMGQKVFLKMNPGITVQDGIAMVSSLGYGSVKASIYPGVIELSSSSKNGFDILRNTNNLALRGDVKYATANMTMAGSKQFVPNDPFFNAQWGFRNTGQIALPGSDPVQWRDIKILPAWDITLGKPEIKILMLDDGLDINHQDINRGEVKDFTTDLGSGAHVSNQDFHGTLVAGCMTAITNNGVGIAGVAGGSKTVGARVHRPLDPFELPQGFKSNPFIGFWTQEEWVADGLLWGLVQGCRVSNNSNFYDFDSELISDLYLLTRQSGIYHFAAAGNEDTTTLPFPADDESVRAITGIDDTGLQMGTTGAGVAFCMPAWRILTTDRTGNAGIENGNYTVNEFSNPSLGIGTSYASAYAAGVVALMLSVNPNLTPNMIDDVLQATAIDMIEPPTETDRLIGFDDKWGWGLINAGQAVANAGFQGVTLSASSVRGGTIVNGRVILLYPTSVAVEARLSSSNPLVGPVPDSVTFNVGDQQANFQIRTTGVHVPTNIIVTATVNDVDRVSSFTVNPPTMASIVVTPSEFTGGNTVNALIKTSGIAGPDGCVITLQSSGAAVRVPASVTIPRGRNFVNVDVVTVKTSLKIVRSVTATTPDGLSKTTSMTINPVTTEVSSLTLNPSSVFGGDTTTGTIVLTNPAPVGGINVTVQDTSSIITPPPFVAFAQGEKTKTFTITTKEVASNTSGTITARYDASKKTATLSIKPTQKIITMTAMPPSITGGFNTKVRIVLYSAAPANGLTISLKDFSSAANTPASVFVPAGVKFVDVTIPTVKVNVNTSVRVRATLPNTRFMDVVFTVTKL